MTSEIRFDEDPQSGWRIALICAGEGAWMWDFEKDEFLICETGKKLLGLDGEKQTFSLDYLSSYIHPDDVETVLRSAEGLRSETIEDYYTECRFRQPDGSYIWVLTKGKIYSRHSSGSPKCAVGTHTDVSKRKELEFNKTQAQDYIRSAFENAAIGMALISPEGKFIQTNSALCKILGYPEEQLLAETFQNITVPDDLDTDLKLLNELVAGKRSSYQLEKRYVHKEGHVVWALLSVSLVRHGDGTPDHFIAQIQDISEQKRYERQLKEARREAEASDRAKSSFLATMSHEIRTPMNAVIGYSELLDSTELDEEQRLFLRHISTSGDLLLHLIDDILDFSKIEVGEIDLEFLDFEIRSHFNQSFDLLRPKAEEKGLSLRSYYDNSVPKQIIGDPHRISQILINLIGNAIKFTPEGEIFISVKTSQDPSLAPNLVVSVHDTGIGISEDQQGLLFKPFHQADSSMTRKYGGTGLGLAISNHLVQAMGGTMSLRSELGKGSTFTFSIPLHTPSSKGTPLPESSSGSIRGKLVLLCDLNPIDRQQTAITLRNIGLLVYEARSFGRAKKELSRSRYDLLILDSDLIRPSALKSEIPDHPPTLFIALAEDVLGKLPAECQRIDRPFTRSQIKDAIMELAPSPAEPEATGKESVAHDEKPKNTLVVEDNPANRRLMQAFLSRLDLKTEMVENGDEAISILQKKRFDLVFLDLQIPGPSGIEVAQKIRELEAEGAHPLTQAKPVRIYAITANAVQGTRERCIEAGMDGFFLKPIRTQEIRKVLGL